jgi:predicted  nucleic acid-binding Zn-ribbon protein
MAIRQPVTVREPFFFADPMTDRLLGAVMALASEVHTLRERTRTLEELLVARGVLAEGDVERFEPDAAQRATRDRELRAIVTRVMSELSRGEAPQSSIDERVIDIARLSHELDLPVTAAADGIGAAAVAPTMEAAVGRHG